MNSTSGPNHDLREAIRPGDAAAVLMQVQAHCRNPLEPVALPCWRTPSGLFANLSNPDYQEGPGACKGCFKV